MKVVEFIFPWTWIPSIPGPKGILAKIQLRAEDAIEIQRVRWEQEGRKEGSDDEALAEYLTTVANGEIKYV